MICSDSKIEFVRRLCQELFLSSISHSFWIYDKDIEYNLLLEIETCRKIEAVFVIFVLFIEAMIRAPLYNF